MQYVRSISGSVSKTWNSINPATLSGAIDVIVVEGEDGTLACSPFHVRFGKFSLLRPFEKKVEFRVHGERQDYAMKLGEGGEAFFVFETSDNIPEALQTSPLVSPASSPPLPAEDADLEPDFLDLAVDNGKLVSRRGSRPGPGVGGIYSSSPPKGDGNLGTSFHFRFAFHFLMKHRYSHTIVSLPYEIQPTAEIWRLVWGHIGKNKYR